MTSIPIVIIHTGYKEYLKVNLEITGKNNKIYLIGDETLKPLDNIHNVNLIDINQYRNTEFINELRKAFVNYSSNGETFEWFCFERIFILKLFLKDKNLERAFHMDSDNILMKDINTYPFEKEIAYCIPVNTEYRMTALVHCGLLNSHFCDEFIQLYKDIYVTKEKFNLISDKVDFHYDKDNKCYVNGGICDMTLYFLLNENKICDVQNLLLPKNKLVFINLLCSAEGGESKTQYAMSNQIISIKSLNKTNYVNDKINNTIYELFNIHFQGTEKKRMDNNLKYLINY